MNVFKYNERDINKLILNQRIFYICAIFAGILLDLLFLFVHTRENSIYFFIATLIVNILMIVIVFYILLVKLKSLKQYLFILIKSKTSLVIGNYKYSNKNQNIKIKDHLSYYLYYFIDEENNPINFYVLYDAELDLKESQQVSISSVDNVILNIEVANNE